ncbi:MAG: FkbM family methyltransferase [Verrucomicrobia bacterium]|jgi:FkbM family methyltransferase|nr:FkbM family methyltransferase [Verrucomicrobiota bacterium]
MSKKSVKAKAIYHLIKSYVRASGKKKSLFIDCGSNVGQGFEFFSKYLRPGKFDYLLIEPNPVCINILRERYGRRNEVEILHAAVWTQVGKMNLYGTEISGDEAPTLGASIIESHNSRYYANDDSKAILVDTLDFAELISQQSNIYDRLVVKMDIESAEYAVLQHLLATGSISNIKDMFVEFHSRFFKEEEQHQYQELEGELMRAAKLAGTNIRQWY